MVLKEENEPKKNPPDVNPLPPPGENEIRLKVKNTKTCLWDDQGLMHNESAIYVYDPYKLASPKGLYWNLKSRKTGKSVQCGQMIKDTIKDRFPQIEQSDFYITIKQMMGFDPLDYYLDILLDQNGSGICELMDVIGSSNKIPAPVRRRAKKGFQASEENSSFVLTTKYIFFKNHDTSSLPQCEQRGEERTPVCECDELGEPLIIDFGNDGLQLTSVEEGVPFDLDNRGRKIQMAWTVKDTNDAFVGLDRNHNGTIDNGSELFGTTTMNPDGTLAANGFEALFALDSSGDMLFDKQDKIYSKVILWFDRNHNGISESQEIIPLSQLVGKINLGYEVINMSDSYGNKIFAESSAILRKGNKKVLAADVWLALEKRFKD